MGDSVNRPYLSRDERKESERFKSFIYEELSKRDRRSSRTRGRIRQHASRVRSPDPKTTLGFWWCGGFCGFAGFRRCGACGCWATGKIFIWNGEDFVLDE